MGLRRGSWSRSCPTDLLGRTTAAKDRSLRLGKAGACLRGESNFLFVDIVGSTEKAALLGDGRWNQVRRHYYAALRRELRASGGSEVRTTGDGMLATFDRRPGAARAIRCAAEMRQAVRTLGLEIRAGLHAGECELVGDAVEGIAVHIGARVMAKAGPDEVLVSSAVKDLVVGSGIRFKDRGAHRLKGVPEKWCLYWVL